MLIYLQLKVVFRSSVKFCTISLRKKRLFSGKCFGNRATIVNDLIIIACAKELIDILQRVVSHEYLHLRLLSIMRSKRGVRLGPGFSDWI